jgi:hypothetical protein
MIFSKKDSKESAHKKFTHFMKTYSGFSPLSGDNLKLRSPPIKTAKLTTEIIHTKKSKLRVRRMSQQTLPEQKLKEANSKFS